MATLRTRLRHVELLIIRPTNPALRYIVIWATWIFIFAMIALDVMEVAPPVKLRAIAYLLLAIITRVTYQNWRPGIDYYPGQRDREGWIAWGLIVLASITWGQTELRALEDRYHLPIAQYAPWVWVIILFVAQVRIMDFVISRNNDPDRRFVKTDKGLVQVPPYEVREHMGQVVAGLLRHGQLSSETRATIAEGLGVAASDIWTMQLLEQAKARREEKARADAALAAVEIGALDDGKASAVETEDLGG